ncbi:uncharacterized protein METZ01_LOCUS78331 [marine metagenome]|uniref:Bacterial surface antigen (D15) domain-containing protein n=1 Tax=marine metagenome TaxID=408172 RepID=A0A381UDQ1_9ZZZZ
MEKKTINRFAFSLLMSAALPFARGSFLSRITKLWFLLCFFMPSMVLSYEFPPERTQREADKELGWMFAPLPGCVEGVGCALPIAGLISNFYKSTDLVIIKTLAKGDIEATVVQLQKFPIIDEKLLLKVLYYDWDISFLSYDRGIHSGKNDYYQTFENLNTSTINLQSQFYNQHLEIQIGYSSGGTKISKIFDADGNQFSNIQSPLRTWVDHTIGTQIDLTDNHLEPREGIRFELLHNASNYGLSELSDYDVNSLNLTTYIPFLGSDTLLINAFQSRSYISEHGLTDENALRNKFSLGCDFEMEADACRNAETKRINYWRKRNQSGKATALGGLNRMRAYSLGRFYAGNSSNYALEYRLNFSEKQTPMNWIILGGVRTVLQASFFYEIGSVSDHISQLHEKMKSSFGVGFRAIISGLIYRIDIAKGEDGIAPTIFINYPLSLGTLGS